MQISELYNIFINHPSISTDSRLIQKDDIFFALSGDIFNGNKFIDKALNSKASFAVTDDIKYKNKKQCIYVENSLTALQELAKYHRQKLNLPIIAITGTNGKTTTKELITLVLNKKYKAKSTKGNFNNHIGVPLTLLSFNKTTEIGIVEMGANHPKEIEFLCNIAQPNYGIITNIGKAHLEGFGSFKNLIKTKAELYNSIKKAKGKIFINDDNELLKGLIENQETISYGIKTNVFSKGHYISANPFVKFELKDSKTIINSQLIGQYNFENLLAASCIGKYFEIPTNKIKEALETYTPKNNRSQIITKNSNSIILDAYNANPTSMTLAIENFENIEAENKVIILGDMFELGKFSDKEHSEIISKVSNFKSINKFETFLAGQSFNKLNKQNNIVSFETTEDLIKHISKIKFKNTWFLIKGSRGMQLERILEHIQFS